MESSKPILLILDPIEIRVLGSLMEKSKTTPEYYPLTLNALMLACNQKSSRNPHVQYDEATINSAINSLTKKGFVSTATGGGNRVIKYKHNFAIAYPDFTHSDMAVLCLLFLRGPLTPGEINSNSARLYDFKSLEEVLKVLEKLKQGDSPFVAQLPRRAGQKEQRFRHLFCEMQESNEEELPEDPTKKLETRLEIVEKELAELKSSVEKLLKEWMG